MSLVEISQPIKPKLEAVKHDFSLPGGVDVVSYQDQWHRQPRISHKHNYADGNQKIDQNLQSQSQKSPVANQFKVKSYSHQSSNSKGKGVQIETSTYNKARQTPTEYRYYASRVYDKGVIINDFKNENFDSSDDEEAFVSKLNNSTNEICRARGDASCSQVHQIFKRQQSQQSAQSIQDAAEQMDFVEQTHRHVVSQTSHILDGQRQQQRRVELMQSAEIRVQEQKARASANREAGIMLARLEEESRAKARQQYLASTKELKSNNSINPGGYRASDSGSLKSYRKIFSFRVPAKAATVESTDSSYKMPFRRWLTNSHLDEPLLEYKSQQTDSDSQQM